jgi:tetratricopeptide (TPR) repeat protein
MVCSTFLALVAWLALAMLALPQASTVERLKQADSQYKQFESTENQEPLKQAVAILDGLSQSEANNYEVAWRRARAYYSLGDDAKANSEKLRLFDQAIQSGKHAVELKPDGVEGHYWLGVSDGEYGQAKGMFKALSMTKNIRSEMEAVIRINPAYQNGGAYLVLGRMDFELPGLMGGSSKRAIQEYEQGLKVAPSNALMKVYLAESYIDAGRKDEARNLLNQVLNDSSDQSPEMRDARKQGRKLYDKHFGK